jgi:hypothetical protein
VCIDCHDQHSGALRPGKTCATCHETQALRGHGTHVPCASCHRPHDGAPGPAMPPACATCHPATKRPGLHLAHTKAACSTCHQSHESAPRDDRAACLTCHPAQRDHELTAKRCATCHPFRH